jgi:hypothetical protein
MRIIDGPVPMTEMEAMARDGFGDLVKAVVDVTRCVMAVGGELHSDEEALLLENGSGQKDLWGINIYPEISGTDGVEFDSMINIRPSQGNRTRSVDDPAIRERILYVVRTLLAE